MSKEYLTQKEAAKHLGVGIDTLLVDYYALGKVKQYRRKGTDEIVYSIDELDRASGKTARKEAQAILARRPVQMQAPPVNASEQAGARDYVAKK